MIKTQVNVKLIMINLIYEEEKVAALYINTLSCTIVILKYNR